MKKLLLLSLLFTSFYISSQTLDSTFGNNGIKVHQFSTKASKDLTYAAAIQSDGKMVYVGKEVVSYGYGFIARVNTSGELDTTFNNYGFKKINFNEFENVFIQTDDKILVSGLGNLYRLNSDGSTDTTFNSVGYISISINAQPFFSKSIIEQSNGKILVSGYTINGTNNDFAIVRLNSDGSYDNTFDTDGKALFPIGTGNDESYGMAVQVDGKIILTGQTYNTTNYDFATIRLNNNGSIDTSFANLGKAIVQFSGQDYGRSVDIQSNGKILIVGSGTNAKLYVIRYNIDGTLDTTFDSDGILASTIGLSTTTSITGVTLIKPKIKSLNDGKILISGTSNTNFSLIKLNSNGTLDTTFGVNGSLESNVLTNDYSNFLFVRSDDKIITGGGIFNGTSIYKMQQLLFSSSGIIESSTSFNLSLELIVLQKCLNNQVVKS